MSTTILADTSTVSVKRRRSPVLFLAKLLVAAGLLIWLFSSGRLEFSSLLKVRHFEYVGFAAGMLLLNMVLLVWRWLWLLRIQRLKVGWLTALEVTWFGYFATIFLPGAAGGDLAKAYAGCRHQPKAKTRAVSTVFMDRAFGLHSMLFVGSLAGMIVLASGCTVRQASIVWFSVLCLAVASVGLFLLLWRPSSGFALRLLPRRFRKALEDSLGLYQRSKGKLAAIWLYSAFCNLVIISTYVLIATALGDSPTAAQVLAVPLVIVAMSLAISPGGLGVGEVVGSQLFAEFGLANGGMIVLIVRLGFVIFSIPGVVAVLGHPNRKEAVVEACL